MVTIKKIETPNYVILLEETEDCRYIVRYKRSSMEEYSYFSFQDYKFASEMFDYNLIALEGH
jgi:hypothetical protein